MKKSFNRVAIPAALAISQLALVQPVYAASVIWTGDTDDSYSTGTNWSGGSAPASDQDTVEVDNANLTGAASASINFDTGADVEVHSMTFKDGTYSTSGDTITLAPIVTDVNSPSEVVHTDLITADNADVTISNNLNINQLVIPREPTNEVFDLVDINAIGTGSITLGGTVTASDVELRLQGNDINITGAATVGGVRNYSNLTIGGAAGSVSGGDLQIMSGSMTLDNAIAALNDRVGDSDAILLENTIAGTSLTLNGNASSAVNEDAGTLQVESTNGSNVATVRVDAAGQTTSITFDGLQEVEAELTSTNGHTDVEVTDTTTGTPRIDFATNGELGTLERVYFDSAPTLTDGLMTNATINMEEFATYDGTLGVKSATTTNTLAGANASDNVFVDSAQNLGSNVTVNSLALGDAVTSTGASTINIASGEFLASGTSSTDVALDFGARQGRMNVIGTTSLSGGINGTNGARMSGGGDLTLGGAGSVSGTVDVDGLNSLTLSVNNALSGADVVVTDGNVALGSTTQNVASFESTGDNVISGNGSIIASGDITIQSGQHNAQTVDANLSGTNITLGASNSVFSRKQTVNGSIVATNDVNIQRGDYLQAHEINGVIAGAADLTVSGYANLNAANTYSGVTRLSGGRVTLSGAGSIAGSSDVLMVGGGTDSLYLEYSGASVNRIGDNAGISLGGRDTVNFTNTAGPAVTESVGTITASGNNSNVIVWGNTTVSASNLVVTGSGSSMVLQMDTASGAKLLSSSGPATYGSSNILDSIFITRTVNGGTLNWFTTYDAVDGVEEAVVTNVASLSGVNDTSLFASVTNATATSIGAGATVGGVVFDTTNTITGGPLNVESGQVMFLQDNDVDVSSIAFGSEKGVISNVGTNTISSNLTGTGGFEKSGSGAVVFDGTSSVIGGFLVADGSLTVTGSVNSDVATNNSASLTLTGGGSISGSVLGDVTIDNQNGGVSGDITNDLTLQNSASYTNTSGRYVYGATVDSSSTYTNAGTTTYISNSGTASNSGTVNRVFNDDSFTNSGDVAVRINNGSLGTVSNTTAGTITFSEDAINEGGIDNRGSLTIEQNVTVSGGGTITQGIDDAVNDPALGSLVVNGRLINDYIQYDGNLGGSGFIQGNVSIFGGTVGPGNSPGDLTIEGNFELGDGAVLNLEYGEEVFDRLIVEGDFIIDPGAAIEIALLDGLTGDDLINDGFSVEDMFVGLTQPELNSLLTNGTFTADSDEGLIDLNFDASGVLQSTNAVVPLPAAVWLFGSALAGLGWMRRRRVAPAA